MKFPIGSLKTSDDLDRLIRRIAEREGWIVLRSDATYDGTGDREYGFADAPVEQATERITEADLRGTPDEVEAAVAEKLKWMLVGSGNR